MEQTKQILLIDSGSVVDEYFFFVHLKKEGFLVRNAILFEDAKTILLYYEDYFSLVFMPVGGTDSGVNEIRALRELEVETPIFAFARDTLSICKLVVESLNAGADECQSIPINPYVWTERVRAVLRRGPILQESIIDYGRMSINITTKEVLIDGKIVHLTRRETGTLCSLAQSLGGCLSKTQILDSIYSLSQNVPDIEAVDVFVCNMRKKIATALGIPNRDTPIRTMCGRGYQLISPSQWNSLVVSHD